MSSDGLLSITGGGGEGENGRGGEKGGRVGVRRLKGWRVEKGRAAGREGRGKRHKKKRAMAHMERQASRQGKTAVTESLLQRANVEVSGSAD